MPTKLALATLRKYQIILKARKRKKEDDMGEREDTVGEEVKEWKASTSRRKEILGEKGQAHRGCWREPGGVGRVEDTHRDAGIDHVHQGDNEK